jgi:hypothetical protein
VEAGGRQSFAPERCTGITAADLDLSRYPPAAGWDSSPERAALYAMVRITINLPGLTFIGCFLLHATRYSARGANQAVPPIPIDDLHLRNRQIIQGILFGAASPPTTARGRGARAGSRATK